MHAGAEDELAGVGKTKWFQENQGREDFAVFEFRWTSPAYKCSERRNEPGWTKTWKTGAFEIFRKRIPKYMLRHKVKAGMTDWQQINGYRGNTSLEKRVEFDIRLHWETGLFSYLKIICKTLLRMTKNAY